MNVVALIVAFAAAILSVQNPARDARLPVAAVASTLRGRVLTDSGQPIRNARVGLALDGHDEGWPVFTDAGGRFQFAALQPGRYILSASKAGYVTTRFGARQPTEPPVPIEVAAGTIVDGIDVHLAKGAAISGRIVDENGDPAIEAAVSAERLVRSGRGLKTITIKSTTTDDLGEYRLPELPAGSYVVLADPGSSVFDRINIAATTGTGGGVRMTVGDLRRGSTAKMYYPSAMSPAGAQILSVQPGEELTTIDMTARPMTPPHLTIVVTDPSGKAADVRYALASDTRADNTMVSMGRLQAGEPEVLPSWPGDWDLLLDGGDAGQAYAHFTVAEGDMSVQAVLQPLVKVSGRVLVDGVDGNDARLRSGARVTIETALRDAARGLPTASHFAQPDADGTFTVDALRGPIEIRLRNAPPGWTLQSVSVAGRELPDTWLDTQSGQPMTDVTLNISTQSTHLSGTVLDSAGQLLAADSVIVFPKAFARLDNPARWARWIKPDASGHFEIRDLPEGDFYVVALRDVDDALWQTAPYLDALRSEATPVSLAAGRVANVSLSVKARQ